MCFLIYFKSYFILFILWILYINKFDTVIFSHIFILWSHATVIVAYYDHCDRIWNDYHMKHVFYDKALPSAQSIIYFQFDQILVEITWYWLNFSIIFLDIYSTIIAFNVRFRWYIVGECYWVVLSGIERYWVLLSGIGYYWALLTAIEYYCVLLTAIDCYVISVRDSLTQRT